LNRQLVLRTRTVGKFRKAAFKNQIGGDGMSKTVMVVLWFLIGLALLAAGVTSMTGIFLAIAGILTIIATIVMAMKKMEMHAPAK
jgi:hypothetical protein